MDFKKAAKAAGWLFMAIGISLLAISCVLAFFSNSSYWDFYFPEQHYYFPLIIVLVLAAIGSFALAAFLRAMARTTGMVMILLCILVFLMAIPPLGSAWEKPKRISCASNLKQIGLGLKQYAIDYNDFFPPASRVAGIETLRSNNYITDYKLFICPSNWHDPGQGTEQLNEDICDYVYIGGLSESCSPDSILAYDKPNNHWRYGNVLFVDGHVEGFRGSNWLEKAQKSSQR